MLAAEDNAGHHEHLRYQELFDFAPEGYVVTDAAGLIEHVNHAAAALLKARREFLIGKPFVLFVAEPGQKLVYAHLTGLAIFQPGAVAEWEVWLRPARSSPVAVNLNVAVVRDEGDRRTLRWRLRDITSHVRAERHLLAEKSLADALVNAAQAAILVLDDGGHVLRSNPFVRQALGYDEGELRGRPWASLLVDPARGEAAALLKSCATLQVGRELTAETIGKGERRRVVAWSAKALSPQEDDPAAVVVVGHDVTELQSAQREAVQSARLAAIGEMMASLTHETRNALQRASACLDRLRWRLADTPELDDL